MKRIIIIAIIGVLGSCGRQDDFQTRSKRCAEYTAQVSETYLVRIHEWRDAWAQPMINLHSDFTRMSKRLNQNFGIYNGYRKSADSLMKLIRAESVNADGYGEIDGMYNDMVELHLMTFMPDTTKPLASYSKRADELTASIRKRARIYDVEFEF